MGGNFVEAIVSIATAVVAVAIVGEIVSSQAQTSNVINAAGNAFSGILKVAVSPVTGGTSSLTL